MRNGDETALTESKKLGFMVKKFQEVRPLETKINFAFVKPCTTDTKLMNLEKL